MAGLVWALFIGLIFGLPCGLLVGLVGFGLRYGLNGGLFVGLGFGLRYGLNGGLFVGLTFGLTIAWRSVVYLLILWISGATPFRYRAFLSQAKELHFLRQVGSGYIFVHRLLQEYFASLSKAEDRAFFRPQHTRS